MAAEAFTAYLDAWKQYPGSMKDQVDWAFATGINKFLYVISERKLGKGKIYWGGAFSHFSMTELYPDYDVTASILRIMDIAEDFASDGSLRYTHQLIESGEI